MRVQAVWVRWLCVDIGVARFDCLEGGAGIAGFAWGGRYNALMPHVARHLVLASRSARREQLLREAGFDFTQAEPPFDDPPQPMAMHVDAMAHACELAARKAVSLAAVGFFEDEPGALILAADTICVADGELIGQPRDEADARAMITRFLNRSHEVVTGVALLTRDDETPTTFADRAAVVVGEVPAIEIDAYVATELWRGKAGGYNLFERVAAGWPIVVRGDEATVVGLPMRRLVPLLKECGVVPSGCVERDHRSTGRRISTNNDTVHR